MHEQNHFASFIRANDHAARREFFFPAHSCEGIKAGRESPVWECGSVGVWER
jgi:hypothetical protein